MEGRPGTIRVMAGPLRQLLETHEASVIEFRDRFGDLNAVVFRQFNDDMWCLITKQDPDWDAILVRLGYLDSNVSAAMLLTGRA